MTRWSSDVRQSPRRRRGPARGLIRCPAGARVLSPRPEDGGTRRSASDAAGGHCVTPQISVIVRVESFCGKEEAPLGIRGASPQSRVEAEEDSTEARLARWRRCWESNLLHSPKPHPDTPTEQQRARSRGRNHHDARSKVEAGEDSTEARLARWRRCRESNPSGRNATRHRC